MIKGIIVSLIRLIHCFCHFELLDEMTYCLSLSKKKKVKKKKTRALLFEETKKKNEFLRFVILLSNTLLYLRHFTMKKKNPTQNLCFQGTCYRKKKENI